jgi:hypothetical protein
MLVLDVAMVEMLILKTKAWEDDRGVPFMFDGVHLFPSTHFLVSCLILFLEASYCLA